MKKDIRILAASLPHFLRMLTGQMGLKVRWQRGIRTAAATMKEVIFEPFYLTENNANMESLIALYYGKAWHEGGHIRHTNFDDMTAWREANLNIESFFMPIEDARMEAAIIREFPGARADLNAAFDTLAEKGLFGPMDATTPKGHLLKWYLGYRLRHLLRHQPQCERWADEALPLMEDAYGQAFMVRLNVLLQTDGRSMKSTQDACNLVEKVVEIAEEEAQQQEAQASQDANADSDAPGQPGSSSQAPSSDDDESDDASGGDDSPQDADAGQEDSQDDAAVDDSNGSSTAAAKAKALRDAIDNQNDDGPDLDKALQQAINEVIEEQKADNSRTKQEVSEDMDDSASVKNLFQQTAAQRYKHDFSEAILASSKLAASIRVKLESKLRAVSPPLNKGRFDPKRIPRIPMGETKLFNKQVEKKALNTAIFLLLDTSSSMTTNARIKLACEAVAATTKALAALPGVTVAAGCFPVGGMMHSFGQKAVQDTDRFAICASGISTPMAQGIAAARMQLNRRQEKRKMLIVLTDGEPDDGFNAILQREITEHYGIEVYGLGIQHRAVHNIFPKARVINTLSELTPELLGLLGDRLYQQVA